MSDRIPVIVLAGSDSRPGHVPEGMQSTDMLHGPKGTLPLRTGRCLAGEVVARLRASQRFADPLLLGPESWYGGKVDCEVVPVTGSLIQTLRTLIELLDNRFAGNEPVAVTACDILPTAREFREAIDQDYSPHRDSMFWWQMILADPDEMGSSGWKPVYQIAPAPGQPRQAMYPGHLVIVRPAALRLQLTGRFLELAYRYRNRSLGIRFFGMGWKILGALVAQDLRNLRSGQLPILTCGLPWAAFREFLKYRRGVATLRDHEQFLNRALLHRQFQNEHGGHPVVISGSRIIALARDIDSRGELEDLDRVDPETGSDESLSNAT